MSEQIINIGGGGNGGVAAGFDSYGHTITWHHDAGTPFDVPFDIDLTNQHLGQSGTMGDNFACFYYGPSGSIVMRVLCSNNDNVDDWIVNIQEIPYSLWNTDFSVATPPPLVTVGSFTILSDQNMYVDVTLTGLVGGSVAEPVSMLYFWAPSNANDLRIFGVGTVG